MQRIQMNFSLSRLRGFTLVELMIVVAIIGILASIALPAYNEHIRKARRADAQTALMELAQHMERHYTINNSYNTASLPSSVTARVSAHYTISFALLEAQRFTIQAVRVGSQTADSCGTMTVTHTGERTAARAGCWN